MNKIIFTFLLAIGFISFANAQDDEKIKGDRNVTIKQTYIEPFNKIIVGEDFTGSIADIRAWSGSLSASKFTDHYRKEYKNDQSRVIF